MCKPVRAGLLAAVLLLLSCVTLPAQRQTSGRPSLDVYVNLSPYVESPKLLGGGGFAWCNYNYSGHTSLGLDVFREPRLYVEEAIYDKSGGLIAPRDEHSMSMWEACLTGGYFHRLLAPRSRVVILSVGGTVLGGVSYCKAITDFKKSDGKNYKPVGIFIGLVPEVQLELFPFRNASLYGSFRPRIVALNGLGGSSEWFRLSFAAGMKFYL